MTELSDSDLRELVEAVWTVTLGFDVLDPAGSIPPPPEQTVCGCVHVSGAWNGLVTVRVSEGLARNVAATMFDTVVAGSQFSFNSPGGVLLREIAFRIKASRVCVQVIEARQRAEALSA